MATALKLRADIRKYEAALKSKATPKSLKEKLQNQIDKAKKELADMKAKPSKTKASKAPAKKEGGIKAPAQYKGSGVDLKKDAERPAKPIGKRKSKSGNTYYEYRLNRLDIKQPPKRYPKLEDGGEVKDYSGEYFSIREFVEEHEGMDKIVAEKYKIDVKDVDDNLDGELGYDTEVMRNLLKGKGYRVSYDKEDDLIIVNKKMAYGGMMAKGGFTDSFEEANKKWNDMSVEDRESLLMKYFSKLKGGSKSEFEKIAREYSHKNFDSQSEFVQVMLTQSLYKEDGGYMAKGGEVWTIGEYQTIEDWNSATKKDGSRTTISAEGYPIRKNGVNVYVVKSKKEAIEKVKRLNSKLADGGYMADGGMMAKGGKLSLDEFEKKYRDNEDMNYHSQNVVLLAENFGSDQDLKDAKRILALHEAIGSLPSFLGQERRELDDKLWGKYEEAMKASGKEIAARGMMIHGGEMHRTGK